jgi:hypothetical protein
MALGTEMNTEVTFLAMFFINFYVSFQNSIPKKVLCWYYNASQSLFILRKMAGKSSIFMQLFGKNAINKSIKTY